MTCSVCGGPLDPCVIHVKHFGCSADDWDDCDCPEVCAGCCTDPDCALRPDQETPMTDPTPLTDDEFVSYKRWVDDLRAKGADASLADRLVATVEQVRRERDEAEDQADQTIRHWRARALAGDAVIRRLLHGAKPKMTLGHRFHRWEIPVFGGEDRHEPMSPDEAEAVRRARAVPGAENETTDA